MTRTRTSQTVGHWFNGSADKENRLLSGFILFTWRNNSKLFQNSCFSVPFRVPELVHQIININQTQTLELSLAAGTTETGHARAHSQAGLPVRATGRISLSRRLCAEPAGCVQNPPHHALGGLTLSLASSQTTSNTRQHSFL